MASSAIIFLLPSSMICLLCCLGQACLFLVGNLSSFSVGQWLPRTLWAQGQGPPFPVPGASVGWDHGGLVSARPLHLSIKLSFFCSQRIEHSSHFEAMGKQAESFFLRSDDARFYRWSLTFTLALFFCTLSPCPHLPHLCSAPGRPFCPWPDRNGWHPPKRLI